MKKKDEKPQEEAEQPQTFKPQKDKNPKQKTTLIVLLIIILLGGSAYAGYYLGNSQAQKKADQQAEEKDQQIDELEQNKADLEQQLEEKTAEAEAAEAENEEATEEEPVEEQAAAASCPAGADLANIKAAVKSKNYAALQGYMANKVNVILAASEGLGPRTPAQAVGDMEYLSGGTGPWNFNLPSGELSGYASGFYSQYFPSDAVVGKSSNKYLVSFTFNSNCKIKGVFITGSTDIL